MTFQFSIWDKFRDLENLPATNFSNLVHLVAHLLKTKSLPLSILKVCVTGDVFKGEEIGDMRVYIWSLKTAHRAVLSFSPQTLARQPAVWFACQSRPWGCGLLAERVCASVGSRGWGLMTGPARPVPSWEAGGTQSPRAAVWQPLPLLPTAGHVKPWVPPRSRLPVARHSL